MLILCLCPGCQMQRGQGLSLPDREIAIPTGASPCIYYMGIPDLPEAGGVTVAHTTIFDGGFRNEDNRLCGVDTDSGVIRWHYPSDLNERHYCSFDGKAHAWHGKLVFQCRPDTRTDAGAERCRTVCIDAEDGRTLWEKDNVTAGDILPRDVVGDGPRCWFTQGGGSITQHNLRTSVDREIFHSDSLIISGISLWGKHLLLCCRTTRETGGRFGNYAVVLNAGTGALELPPRHIREDCVPLHGVISDGVLYADSDTFLTAVEIRGGKTLWTRDDSWAYSLMDMFVCSSAEGPSRRILLRCSGNSISGYDCATGRILYEYRNYGTWRTSVDGRTAYILNRRQEVDVMDIATGEFTGTLRCPGEALGEDFTGSYPVIRGRHLYIMGSRHLFRYTFR